MAQLQKGVTFSPGDTVEAADLNNLVDAAVALKGIIAEQGAPVSAATNDHILITDTSDGGDLKRALISSLPGAGTVTSVAFDSGYPTPDSVFSGTVQTGTTTAKIRLSLDNQAAGKVLAGPVSGGLAEPSFRVLSPRDTILYQEVALHLIDCALGNVFRKQLSGGAGTTEALKLNNGVIGQRITVYLIQSAAPGDTDVTWDTVEPGGVVRWPGGTDHTMTIGGIGRTDIVNFLCMGSELYYGTFDKNFIP